MTHSKLVKIEGKEYTLKSHSYRALFLYEEITNKNVADLKTTQEQVTLIYCLLKVSNDDFDLSLGEFFDVLDIDDSVIMAYYEITKDLKKK